MEEELCKHAIWSTTIHVYKCNNPNMEGLWDCPFLENPNIFCDLKRGTLSKKEKEELEIDRANYYYELTKILLKIIQEKKYQKQKKK